MTSEINQSFQMKVYDYVRSIISTLQNPSEYERCDFSILCDKYPLMIGRTTFRGRVLYISLANSNNSIKLYPNKIAELGMNYITITSNLRRRLSVKSQEFFINGNTDPQEYKGNTYYNYSLERTDVATRNKITQLRQKYDIKEPEIFIGKHQDLII